LVSFYKKKKTHQRRVEEVVRIIAANGAWRRAIARESCGFRSTFGARILEESDVPGVPRQSKNPFVNSNPVVNVPSAEGDHANCDAGVTNTDMSAQALVVPSCQLMSCQGAALATGTLHLMVLPTPGAIPVLALATNKLLGSSVSDFFYPVVPLISFSVDHDARSIRFPRLLGEGCYCLLAPRMEDISAIHAELLAWGCVVKVKERACHVTTSAGGRQGSPPDKNTLVVGATNNVSRAAVRTDVRAARSGARGVVTLSKELMDGIAVAARAMSAETDAVVSCKSVPPMALQGPARAKAVGSSLRRAAVDLFGASPQSTGPSSNLAHKLTHDDIHTAGQLLRKARTRVVDQRVAGDGTGLNQRNIFNGPFTPDECDEEMTRLTSPRR
jgi:hypothetical protein